MTDSTPADTMNSQVSRCDSPGSIVSSSFRQVRCTSSSRGHWRSGRVLLDDDERPRGDSGGFAKGELGSLLYAAGSQRSEPALSRILSILFVYVESPDSPLRRPRRRGGRPCCCRNPDRPTCWGIPSAASRPCRWSLGTSGRTYRDPESTSRGPSGSRSNRFAAR